VVSFTPRAKNPFYPFHRRLDGPNISLGEPFLGLLARSPVIMSTELSRLIIIIIIIIIIHFTGVVNKLIL
jgi:hypothetical protein